MQPRNTYVGTVNASPLSRTPRKLMIVSNPRMTRPSAKVCGSNAGIAEWSATGNAETGSGAAPGVGLQLARTEIRCQFPLGNRPPLTGKPRASIRPDLVAFAHHSSMLRLTLVLVTAALSSIQAQSSDDQLRTDWANLARYRDANAKLPAPGPGEHRVVFMGNSITEAWAPLFDSLFPGKPYIGRGISGQTTPQMLVRFRQDVVDLHPAVVVILGGTNDIAGNTGPSTLEMIEDNLASMTEIAQANGIRVVLASVLPVFDYPWRRGLEPAPKIIQLNKWIKAYAQSRGAVYLDLYSAMADARGGLPAALSKDGVHPNTAGYAVMAPLTDKAIAAALARKPRQTER